MSTETLIRLRAMRADIEQASVRLHSDRRDELSDEEFIFCCEYCKSMGKNFDDLIHYVTIGRVTASACQNVFDSFNGSFAWEFIVGGKVQ